MNRLFNELYYRFDYPVTCTLPEGYELVETKDHKRERLQKEIEEKKASVEYLTRRLTELTANIESEEKELLALSQ